MSEVVIKLENLSKRFGNFTAVDKINLEVCKGETIGLVGPNGAGKTTTIKMIAKILRPNGGRILIKTNQRELTDLEKVSAGMSRIGFLIDIPNFYNIYIFSRSLYSEKITGMCTLEIPVLNQFISLAEYIFYCEFNI